MIDISVKDLVKSFDADTNILDGITFDVQSGERVGLLGKNGAGKTTLFRILTGEIDYNSGEVRFAPGKKVGLISRSRTIRRDIRWTMCCTRRLPDWRKSKSRCARWRPRWPSTRARRR